MRALQTNIHGQMLSKIVKASGFGSALSAGLMMRKERAAPHERDSTDVTREISCMLLYSPVLSTINT